MSDDAKRFEIIENTEEAMEEFGYNYGADAAVITKNDIQALLDGKCLAIDINDEEYSFFVTLADE